MKLLSTASKQRLVKLLRIIIDIPLFPLGLILISISLIPARICALFAKHNHKPRLMWGATPIKSLAYMANSLKHRGYKSHSVVLESSTIYKKSDFDYQLLPSWRKHYLIPLSWFWGNIRSYLFLLKLCLIMIFFIIILMVEYCVERCLAAGNCLF